MDTKVCTKCGVEKELVEFHKNNNTKDKRENTCKPCRHVIGRLTRHKRREKEGNPIQKKRYHSFDKGEAACSICGKVLLLRCFRKMAHAATGYQASCKECTNEREREQRWRKPQLQKMNNSLPEEVITHRYCNGCYTIKEIGAFGKARNGLFGVEGTCKECVGKKRKRRHEGNKEYYKARNKEYYKGRKEKAKAYNMANREKYNAYKKEWYQKNKESHYNNGKKWREANREKYNKMVNERRINNPILRLNESVSLQIWKSLKDIGEDKNGRQWESIVEYTKDDLVKHLESQFKEGMSWDNYGKGGWTLDHKIPKTWFNITSEKSKGFKKCWALENLQPLWESDNASKNNRYFG